MCRPTNLQVVYQTIYRPFLGIRVSCERTDQLAIQTPKEVEMTNLRFDIYESFTHEKNSRILKASDDARVLRSISKGSEAKSSAPSRKASRPKLANVLASLLIALKGQPA